ncbi:extracellular solute-binding protein [Seminavis robusta]|uniref:Extracellular solute-binding protein n=1 Tax=Seminavis robusta TaxID=568900 RepID=A0A9N8H6B7_9STRA|nr:extracellular solute-binding protein [Seminavis robusta]|eukprot:Sro141_g065930.1 extracellular solute-binding protein (866) ;mRNA; r:86501-89191
MSASGSSDCENTGSSNAKAVDVDAKAGGNMDKLLDVLLTSEEGPLSAAVVEKRTPPTNNNKLKEEPKAETTGTVESPPDIDLPSRMSASGSSDCEKTGSSNANAADVNSKAGGNMEKLLDVLLTSEEGPLSAAVVEKRTPPTTNNKLKEEANAETTGTVESPLDNALPTPMPLPSNQAQQPTSHPGAYAVGTSFTSSYTTRPNGEDNFIGGGPETAPELSPTSSEPPPPPPLLQGTLVHLDATTQRRTPQAASCHPAMEPISQLAITGTAVRDDDSQRRHAAWFALAVLVMMAVIVALVLGLLGVFDGEESLQIGLTGNKENENGSLSTLQRIKQEGTLRCEYRQVNIEDIAGFSYSFCLAVTAAIFGPEAAKDKMDFQEYKNRTSLFAPLAEGQVDLYSSFYTHTMERDVLQTQVKTGLSFTPPCLYIGMGVAGDPFHVGCVEDNFKHLDECQSLKVCVGQDTTYESLVQSTLPRRFIVPVETVSDVETVFVKAGCNVLATASFATLSAEEVVAGGYNGSYVRSERYFSKEPTSLATREDDPEFTAFVGAIMDSLNVAELHNITQATAHMFPATQVFGTEYEYIFQNAIAAVGNYGEIYDRHMAKGIPRATINQINRGTTGLLLSHPFGAVGENVREEDKIPLGDYLQSIVERGGVRCGISANAERAGFASKVNSNVSSVAYKGFEIDLCRALSTSLFQGQPNNIQFIEVEEPEDGFALLASGEIDVLAGVTSSLQNRVKEPTTGLGYSFSAPYFYDSAHNSNLCMATNQDARDWSAWVYWIVNALIFAEEQDIGQATSSMMPEVLLFGTQYKRMLRDAVLEVGSYSDIFNRNLKPMNIPRTGQNMLNLNSNQGPQRYAPPGFI